MPSDEEAADMAEETGWKLVYAPPCPPQQLQHRAFAHCFTVCLLLFSYADVFRAPSASRTYAVLHGAGAQFFLLVSLTLAFAALGFLSPSNRACTPVKTVWQWLCDARPGGSLLTAIVVFFALSG